MQKTGIVVSMIIWIMLALNVINGYSADKHNITEAFLSIDFENTTSEIQGVAECSDGAADVELFLKETAIDIGCNTDYVIEKEQSDNGVATSLIKDSGYVQLTIKYIEKNETEHYVSISMIMRDNIQSALSYKQLIEEIYEKNNMSGNVTLCFKGELAGPMNYGEKNIYADNLIDLLDAQVVAQNRDSSIFTVYAYTKSVDEYIVVSGKKVNINIILEYDEISDITLIYLATPFNNLDY